MVKSQNSSPDTVIKAPLIKKNRQSFDCTIVILYDIFESFLYIAVLMHIFVYLFSGYISSHLFGKESVAYEKTSSEMRMLSQQLF